MLLLQFFMCQGGHLTHTKFSPLFRLFKNWVRQLENGDVYFHLGGGCHECHLKIYVLLKITFRTTIVIKFSHPLWDIIFMLSNENHLGYYIFVGGMLKKKCLMERRKGRLNCITKKNTVVVSHSSMGWWSVVNINGK